MKIKQKSSKKVLIISLSAIALVLIGLSYYVFAMNGSLFGWKFRADTTSNNSINLEPATAEQQQAGNDAKQETIDDEGKPGTGSDTPTEPSDPSELAVSFTAVNQNGSTLQARAQISPLIANGTCTLKLTKDGTTVTKTAAVSPTATISTCQGFDISTSELSPGMWALDLDVTSEGKTGHAATSIQVE